MELLDMILASRLEAIPAMILIWMLFLLPSVIPLGFWIWHVRWRIKPNILETTVLVLPYLVFSFLYLFMPGSKKTFANLNLEAIILGCFIAALCTIRVFSIENKYGTIVFWTGYAFSILLAVALWWLYPCVGCR